MLSVTGAHRCHTDTWGPRDPWRGPGHVDVTTQAVPVEATTKVPRNLLQGCPPNPCGARLRHLETPHLASPGGNEMGRRGEERLTPHLSHPNGASDWRERAGWGVATLLGGKITAVVEMVVMVMRVDGDTGRDGRVRIAAPAAHVHARAHTHAHTHSPLLPWVFSSLLPVLAESTSSTTLNRMGCTGPERSKILR